MSHNGINQALVVANYNQMIQENSVGSNISKKSCKKCANKISSTAAPGTSMSI